MLDSAQTKKVLVLALVGFILYMAYARFVK